MLKSFIGILVTTQADPILFVYIQLIIKHTVQNISYFHTIFIEQILNKERGYHSQNLSHAGPSPHPKHTLLILF